MSQELKEAVNELAATHPEKGSHPEPDELAAYHGGELSPERERQIQDHLAACRECAGLLLDLDGLADPDFGADGGLAGKEAVWKSLQEKIGEQDVAAPVVPFRRSAVSNPRWFQALAAALLVATLGLSLWVASLRRTVQELAQPEWNAVPLDLDSGTARGEGSPEPVVTLPSDRRHAILILSPHGPRRDKYQAVIERANGEWIGSGWLRRNEVDSLSLGISPRALGPGDFRIRLLGEGGETIEEYALRIQSP